jgi:hypothetical protein
MDLRQGLDSEDFAAGVRLAVNHGGDSDSTGAIAGNLLGTALGVSSIPQRWLDKLELRTEIETIADDMLIWISDDRDWWTSIQDGKPLIRASTTRGGSGDHTLLTTVY